MTPAGPLMIEHRVIERMIAVMAKKLAKMRKDKAVDDRFIDTAVDFIRTYADRCHHGKEEDILFRGLGKKKISAEHKKIMNELVHEHIMGRENVKKLVAAKESYLQGNKDAFRDIESNMQTLVEFYPKHIEKEDKHFFLPCMDYFSDREKKDMLEEYREFDKQLIHEKYLKLVEALEK